MLFPNVMRRRRRREEEQRESCYFFILTLSVNTHVVGGSLNVCLSSWS